MIRRRCTEGSCKNGRRCLEHLRFDVMYQGQRYRIPANDFAIPRMEPGKQRPIQSMEEARDWERRFIGEIKAGRDPRNPPNRPKKVNTEIRNVFELLDAYWERCVRPAGLRSAATVRSQIRVLRSHRQRQGKPPNPVQPEGTARGDPQATTRARSGRVCVREHERRVPTHPADRVGDAEAPRQRPHAEDRGRRHQGEPEAAATDRSAMARPAARRRLSPPRRRRGHPDHSADARTREHPADAALSERDR